MSKVERNHSLIFSYKREIDLFTAQHKCVELTLFVRRKCQVYGGMTDERATNERATNERTTNERNAIKRFKLYEIEKSKVI